MSSSRAGTSGLDSTSELRPFALRIVLADLAKLTPAELDALKRRHRAALAVLADIEQEQRPLLLAAVVWPSEAVERAAHSVVECGLPAPRAAVRQLRARAGV